MELSIYDIIIGPVASDKAYSLTKRHQQLMVKVHICANKVLIKNAIEKIFNVKVDSVRTATRKYTKVRVVNRRHNAHAPVRRVKIAYVSLAEGHVLNLLEQANDSRS
jgi:large subunit ribosomal protein L23